MLPLFYIGNCVVRKSKCYPAGWKSVKLSNRLLVANSQIQTRQIKRFAAPGNRLQDIFYVGPRGGIPLHGRLPSFNVCMLHVTMMYIIKWPTFMIFQRTVELHVTR